MSSGATVRRSITSTEMPSSASSSAAATASCTIRETDTTVTSVPGRTTADRADRHDVVGRRLRSLHAVEQPVLDEHDRVRVLDRGAQQAVRVGRGRRHDDAQPGDVREQRLEALRVLAPRRAPGAELGAHGQRHLRGAAGHERQLGGLVEQLVEADAEEVEVHELDDRAHAGHRGADAEADDRALGDRGVADAIAEAVVQPARQAEHVAAGRDVDARDEHALVARELGFERAIGSRPWCGTPARRRRVPAARRARVSVATTKSVSVAAAGAGSRRAASTASSSSCATDDSHGFERVVGDAVRSEAARADEQRIARLPLADLVGRSVALRVAFVVTVPAVGGGLDDDRTAAGAGRLDHRRHRGRGRRRRRCRRPRRSRRRSPRRAARAAPRAGPTRARTRRSRCSRRRRSPAASRPRRG